MGSLKILAIETSCDETAAAIIEEQNSHPVVISNVVSSQIDLHAKYGGVVPEVAARAHIEEILPIIKETLKKAKLELSDVDYLAVTYGPGLVGSLVVGVETAKGISAATDIPIIPINHLEGHIYANFLQAPDSKQQAPSFPLLSLLVSGGHTLLVFLKNHLDYKIVGESWDDAAGEAFDKAAKAMGLPYPGGPKIAELAKEGDPERFPLPVIDLTPSPKRNEEGFLEKPKPSLDFSFSGLKTALINEVKQLSLKGELTGQDKKDLAASFQKAVVDTLVQNSLRAIKEFDPKTFILSGGVAANEGLRVKLKNEIKKVSPETNYLIPELSFCTDNAAMIGAAAFYHLKENKIGSLVAADPNAKLN